VQTEHAQGGNWKDCREARASWGIREDESGTPGSGVRPAERSARPSKMAEGAWCWRGWRPGGSARDRRAGVACRPSTPWSCDREGSQRGPQRASGSVRIKALRRESLRRGKTELAPEGQREWEPGAGGKAARGLCPARMGRGSTQPEWVGVACRPSTSRGYSCVTSVVWPAVEPGPARGKGRRRTPAQPG
jgi:hypothetical protein